MINLYQPYDWNMDKIGELIGWGLQISLVVIFVTSLIGFTINKLIKLILGRN